MRFALPPASLRISLLLGLALAVGACNNVLTGTDNGDGGTTIEGDGGTAPPIDGLRSLTILPQSAVLTVDDLTAPRTQAFQAMGRFDSEERDVSRQVGWRLDNATIGGIAPGGLFTTSNQAGGRATVTATAGTLSATATVEVRFQPVIKAPDAPPGADTTLPPGAPGTVVAGKSPVPVYPSSQTLFPRNLYKVLFQWDTAGNDLFRLEFKSAFLTLSVYTTKDRWEPTAAQWAYMANSNAGGKVTWTVFGVSRAAPAQVYRSGGIDIGFSPDPVEGAIYYWSTTVAGVRRATVSDAAPLDFFTPTQTGKCVACHTLSRNGQRLAADVGGEVLGVVDVKKIDPPVINWAQKIAAAWTTFSPDTSRVVTASKGVLSLRDGQSGQLLSAVPTGGAGRLGTQPDWAPSGKMLVFAQSAVNKDRGISASSIAVVDYDGTAFKNPRVLVASTGKDDSSYYPSFSPDSQWIAFVRATGGSDNNNTARLLLVSADGTKGPFELAAGNTVVNNQTLSGMAAQLGNTMPTWAPTRPGAPAFLAFSSLRAYGKIYKYKDVKQLWVMGLDLSLLPGKDASFPAFRLPFQDLDENNHRPFWAEDALAPPPPNPDGGTGDGGMCVPLHGDCTSGTRCCVGLFCTEGTSGYTCEPLG